MVISSWNVRFTTQPPLRFRYSKDVAFTPEHRKSASPWRSTLIMRDHYVLGTLAFPTSRPHSFGLVFDGPAKGSGEDYLHDVLLSPENKEQFLNLIEEEGLVVCKNVHTSKASYRRVRGKSSFGKLSQAEYYHHDGCSAPSKPRVVEIRLPYQDVGRTVATGVARFPNVIHAMFAALPKALRSDAEIEEVIEGFSVSVDAFPDPETWDHAQGRVTRLVRRKLDAEQCRAYFREVDQLAGAYVLPWEMGESRLILNAASDLRQTMQHRRAYQRPRLESEQNGSLCKRWTAEELL